VISSAKGSPGATDFVRWCKRAAMRFCASKSMRRLLADAPFFRAGGGLASHAKQAQND
jgi:hypothetical protein